jgi:hypothetical protein
MLLLSSPALVGAAYLHEIFMIFSGKSPPYFGGLLVLGGLLFNYAKRNTVQFLACFEGFSKTAPIITSCLLS